MLEDTNSLDAPHIIGYLLQLLWRKNFPIYVTQLGSNALHSDLSFSAITIQLCCNDTGRSYHWQVAGCCRQVGFVVWCIPNRNSRVNDWCKEMSSYIGGGGGVGARCKTTLVFLTFWPKFLTSFSCKRFVINIVDKSLTEHFLAANLDILANNW